MSALVGRYLVPFSVVPLSPANVSKVGRTLLAAYQSNDEALALPSAVGIDVSDACNIACAVCSREIDWDKRHTSILKFEDFVRLYEPIRPVYLSLSGYGETLLNKHLPRMVAHATAAGSRVNIVTNGTLLDAGRAHALVEAGLAKMKVSIDAADPDVYATVRAGADLEQVLRNIERLVALRDANRKPGPQIEIQFVLFQGNVDQVCKLIELCHHRLPGIEPNLLVMFTYGEQADFVAKTIPFGDPTALDELRRARVLAEGYGFRRTVGSIDAAIVQLTRDLASAPCYVPWYSCLISTDGEVYPCCYHSIRGTSVGNALQEPFADIWNGPRMRAFRAQLRVKRCADKVCATCRYEDAPMDRVFNAVAKVPGLGRGSARFGG
ncbi:MAG: radical SAM protein [Pseudomonadota bacterium]|nr:radical SAM protein [Pseudomonadota bacterium]